MKRHTGTMIDQLRAAAEALNRGDPEPFAALFAEDAVRDGKIADMQGFSSRRAAERSPRS
jgi:hypothetical protein